MADFHKFLPRLFKNEGYYSNNPNDSGGETWKGISRNNYPSWSGWSIIDSYKEKDHFPSSLRTDINLQTKVIEFYKSSQWDPIHCDEIKNQSIAEFIADWCVNAGLTIPIKHVQRILGLDDDGKVGPRTINAINTVDGKDFFEKLKQDRIKFYHDVVEAHPKNAVFLSNWLERTNSFNYSE